MLKLKFWRWSIIIIYDLSAYHVAKNPIRKKKDGRFPMLPNMEGV